MAELSPSVHAAADGGQLHGEISRLEAQFSNLLNEAPSPFAPVLSAARASGSDTLLARALCLMARYELIWGRLEAGIALAEESIAAFARLDEDLLLRHAGPHAEAWRVAGNGWLKLGDIARALPQIERSIALAEMGVDAAIPDEASISALPARSSLVRGLNNLAMALIGMRETAGARAALQQAMTLVDAHPETVTDIPDDVVYIIGNLVELLLQEAAQRIAAGEPARELLDQARALLEGRALEIVRGGDAGVSKLSVLAQRDFLEAAGQTLLLEGRLDEARVQFQRLADQATSDRWRGAIGQRGLAEVLLAQGRAADALVHAREALAAYDTNEEVIDRAAVHLVLSRIHRALGQDHEALIDLEEHHRLRSRIDAVAARHYASHMAARIGLERARTEAEAHRRIASELAALNGRLVEQAAALQRQTDALGLARTAAEEASRAKSAFLANMSHELRTPLNAILGFAEMLRDGYAGPPGPAWTGYAGMVHEAGSHLLKVIGEILDLSKIEAGRVVLSIEPVDLAHLFEACREWVAPAAERAGLVLSVLPVPALDPIPADATRLKQILLNLLSNATKFTEPGGQVTLAAEPEAPGYVAIRVADTGIGMSTVDMQRAFEVFGQVETGAARRHQGTGLGLPIAKSLVELHGGTLKIDSRKGVGTIVTVILPR